MENKELTIIIPTYNRFDRLCRQLRSISTQGHYDKYFLLILDNHSDYCLKEEIKNVGFEEAFLNNIEIIERPINTKMGYNVASPYLYNKTKWLFMLSDDDISKTDFIETLFYYIQLYPNVSMVKFSLGLSPEFEDILIDSVEKLKKCYHTKKYISGDLLYLGTNLINTERIANYLGDSFEYSTYLLGFILPILHQLVVGEAQIILSAKHVQTFVSNTYGDSWHGLSSLLKISQHYDIRWEKPDDTKQLFRLIFPHFPALQVATMLLMDKNFKYQRYAYKRLRQTLFDKRMNLFNTLVFFAYNVECFTTVPLITRFVPYLTEKKLALIKRIKRNNFFRELYYKKRGHYPYE